MIILDIGCGNKKYKSKNPKDVVIGIDKRKNTVADKVCDVEKKIPLPSNYVDKVVTIHTLEHTKDLIKVMEEVWRVCKHGAEVFVNVPYWTASGAYSDPTHVRFFTYNSFDYFKPDFEYEHYSKAQFKIKKRRIMFFGENLPPKYKILSPIGRLLTFFINLSPILYQSTFLSYLLPAREIHFWLECKKGKK
jgi:ubiquinone/menaquinone biosynthesis C-methylase UbiE